MGALAQEPVRLLFCRPWQEKRGAFLLWIALEYTHPGPDGESFASSVLWRTLCAAAVSMLLRHASSL